MISRRTLAAAAALPCVLAARSAGGESRQDGSPVVILVSAGPAAYEEAAHALKEALLPALDGGRMISVTLYDPERLLEARRALSSPHSLTIAIGSRAAQLAHEDRSKVPLIYTMVLDPPAVGLPGPGATPADPVTGITMNVPPERHFDLLHEMLPGARRIGVLYDPSISGEEVRRGKAAAAARGLILIAQAVRSQGDVLAAAGLLAPRVDAFWAVADSTVLTSANARALILLALRTRKPFFALSEGFVRSGALAALAADPREAGRKAGEQARRALSGVSFKDMRPEPAPRLSLFINTATAEHLGLRVPEAVLAKAQAVYPQP